MAWWDDSWDYYIPYTIDADKVGATHTNFTVTIMLDGFESGFWENVKNGGLDIRITLSDDSTQLARHIVKCDTSTQKGQLKLLIPSLSGSTDTELHIYFGNAAASEPAANSTYGQYNAYNSNQLLAHDCGQDPSGGSDSILDGTSGQWHGTPNGSMVLGDSVIAKLGNGLQFEVLKNQFINMGNTDASNDLKPDLPMSVFCIYKPTSVHNARIFSNDSFGDASSRYYGMQMDHTTGMSLRCHYGDGGIAGGGTRRSKLNSNTTFSVGTFYHIGCVIQGATDMQLYVNGSDDGGSYSGSGGPHAYSDDPTTYAADITTVSNSDGIIDNVSFFKSAFSASEASTKAENEFNFATFGASGTPVVKDVWVPRLIGDAA